MNKKTGAMGMYDTELKEVLRTWESEEGVAVCVTTKKGNKQFRESSTVLCCFT
jgi:hypothetical protein